jgi:hypothetical protein
MHYVRLCSKSGDRADMETLRVRLSTTPFEGLKALEAPDYDAPLIDD